MCMALYSINNIFNTTVIFSRLCEKADKLKKIKCKTLICKRSILACRIQRTLTLYFIFKISYTLISELINLSFLGLLPMRGVICNC